MVKSGEHAVVDYKLKLDDGTEYVNTMKAGEPFEFIVGTGVMLPDFELAVMGMDIGETRSIHVPVDRAYGERDESLVISVPPTSLPDGEPIPEGATIGLNTPEGVMRVKVVSVSDDEIILDCNHELAGRALNFDITLREVHGQSLIENEKHAAGCTCGCDRLQQAIG